MPGFLDINLYRHAFIAAFSVLSAWFAIPSILHVARARHLYDDVGHFRKQHDHGIPRLGGIAIFASFSISMLAFSIIDKALPVSYLLIASIILCAVGLKDDLSGVNPGTKFLAQSFVAAILVCAGNVRLSGMYGILGIHDLNYTLSVALSILFIMLVINAFNLIDGIDGLAGIICVVVNGTFSLLAFRTLHYESAAIALSIAAASAGFLRYNLTPARIFMGDTGSLFIGLISAFNAIGFIEANKAGLAGSHSIDAAPAVAFAILIVPIFDTLRVFLIRVINGVSPFAADRNHIHHRILQLGFSHLQATLILAAVNLASISVALCFHQAGDLMLICWILSIAACLNWFLTYSIRSRERKHHALRNFLV